MVTFKIAPKGSASVARGLTKSAAARTIVRALRRPRVKKVSVRKLASNVRSLKLQANGALQMDRQTIKWKPAHNPPTGSPQVRNQPTNLRPICWLHQAISSGAQVHSCAYDPHTAPAFSVLNQLVVGNWGSQPFPLTTSIANGGYGCDPNIRGPNDQLQYYGSSQGVQNKYMQSTTVYNFSITAQEVRGYLDIFMIHPKKNFIRSTQKDVSIPDGLPGFCNLSLGVANSNQYAVNPLYYTKKHLKRHYFNTVDDPGAPNERLLQTNPDYNFNLTVKAEKSRSVIKAPELFQGGILDYTDIPLHKQDWILVSTTLENADVGPSNYLEVNIIRNTKWRDLLGASA